MAPQFDEGRHLQGDEIPDPLISGFAPGPHWGFGFHTLDMGLSFWLSTVYVDVLAGYSKTSHLNPAVSSIFFNKFNRSLTYEVWHLSIEWTSEWFILILCYVFLNFTVLSSLLFGLKIWLQWFECVDCRFKLKWGLSDRNELASDIHSSHSSNCC